MKPEGNPLPGILGGVAGSSPRPRIAQLLDDHANEIGAALRRAIPALMRKGVPITKEPARVDKVGPLLAGLAGPYYHVPLATDPGGCRAMLILDAGAIAYLVDVSLGAPTDTPQASIAADLSGMQKAALATLVAPMIRLISDVTAGFGVRLQRLPPSIGAPEEGEFAYLSFRIGSGSGRNLIVAFARDAVSATAGVRVSPTEMAEVRVPSILATVEVEVSVELGRARRRLVDVGRLKVGDFIRLDTALRAPILIRVEGHPVMIGQPTANGEELAVRIIDFIEAPRAPAREVKSPEAAAFNGAAREV